MILGLAQEQLKPDSSIKKHLSYCTGCGACEAMCPSRVPFMLLMDNSKHCLSQKSLVLRTLLFLVRHPGRYSILSKLLRNQTLGSLLRLSGLLRKETKDLQQSIKDTPNTQQLASLYPAKGQVQGDIGLFTGCITRLFDQNTLIDSIRLLTHCGYNVHVSRQQACCGAMHQHNGDIKTAELLIQQNQNIFETKTLDAVITTATGCGAQLTAKLNNIAIYDIMQFIREKQLLQQLSLQPLSANALVHEPCSQRNQLKLPSINSIMEQIPDLKLNNLSENHFCCGAGGINMLTVTESANQLRQNKIDHMQSASPDMVITTNYGCALHLASGANHLSQNKQIEFCHPVSLLVRSASLQ